MEYRGGFDVTLRISRNFRGFLCKLMDFTVIVQNPDETACIPIEFNEISMTLHGL